MKGDKKRGVDRELLILNQFAQSLLTQKTLDDLLWSMAQKIGDLLGWVDCVIYLKTGDLLTQYSAYGHKQAAKRSIQNCITLEIGQGIVGQVAKTGEALMIADVTKDSRYISDLEVAGSEITVPILYQGRVLAVIDSEAPELDAFNGQDLRTLSLMASMAAPRIAFALEEAARREAEDQLRIANEVLEQRVVHRTEELECSNRQLFEEVERRKSIERDLLHEREQLKTTIGAISDGIITIDASYLVRIMNPGARLLCGVKGDPIGHELFDYFQPIDEHEDPIPLELDQLSYTKFHCEFAYFLGQNPGKCPISFSFTPIHGDEKQILGAVLVFRDISQEIRTQQERMHHQKLESIGTLAGGIAHDFNNLLTSILGGVNLAQMYVSPQKEIQESLEMAEKACIRAQGLTKQLLTFSSGGTPVKSSSQLKEILNEAIDLSLMGSNVNCVRDFDSLPILNVDRGQIIQVFNNILINAKQAMGDGGTVRIHTETYDSDNRSWIVISFKDQGSGISSEDLDKIFDPYFTTKSTGTGLGLATAFWIVKRHGGSIDVQSVKDGGSIFRVKLPLEQNKSPEKMLSNSPVLKGSGRVLILDDDSNILQSTSKMFQYLGMPTQLASHGLGAIELARKAQKEGSPFTIAILDLTIPGGPGGVEVAPKLLEINPSIKLIVCSGYANSSALAQYQEYGFHARLEKPFSLQQLSACIQELS